MGNATDARQAVFELFQDLEGFSLDDYKPLAGTDEGMKGMGRDPFSEATPIDPQNQRPTWTELRSIWGFN
jgi:hypothetical protein